MDLPDRCVQVGKINSAKSDLKVFIHKSPSFIPLILFTLCLFIFGQILFNILP